jgi:hypothetical protein
MELIALAVQEFHLNLVKDRTLDPIFRAEPIFSLAAGLDIAQLGLNHPAPVAGRDMADGHHAPKRAIVIEHHTGPKLRRLYQHLELTLGLIFTLRALELTDLIYPFEFAQATLRDRYQSGWTEPGEPRYGFG